MDVRILGTEHNHHLLRLTDACSIPGGRTLRMLGSSAFTMDRSPDYFAIYRDTPGRTTVFGVIDDDSVIGTVSVTERRIQWEGAALDALYVGDLRVHPAYRRRQTAYRLIRAIREHYGQIRPRYASVLPSNEDMHPLLRERARLGRTYHQIDRLTCFAVFTGMPPLSRNAYEVTEAGPADENLWKECFSTWSRTRNVVVCDPPQPVAEKRRWIVTVKDEPVAIGSLVDQTEKRRLIPIRLSLPLQIIRVLVNAGVAVVGGPRISGEGKPILRGYLGNLLYQDQHPGALKALVSQCVNVLKMEGIPFCQFCLSEHDPALQALKGRFPARRFSLGLWMTSPPAPPSLPTAINLHEWW